MDLNIKTDIVTTVRELEQGDHYITLTQFRKYGARFAVENVKIRTADPFVSKTLLGTTIRSYPSEKVHPVQIIQPGAGV